MLIVVLVHQPSRSLSAGFFCEWVYFSISIEMYEDDVAYRKICLGIGLTPPKFNLLSTTRR